MSRRIAGAALVAGVVALLAGLLVVSAPSVRAAAIAAPAAPVIGTAVAGNRSATVTWSASTTGAVAYIVTPYVGYGPRPSQTFSSSATTQTVTGLQNGTQYRFRVQAVTAAGTSGFSRVTNPVVPAEQPPGAPTIIRNATAFDGQATVSWTAPATDGGAPITAYRVTPYVGYGPRPAQTFSSTTTTQVVTGLTNGTTYRFRVQALNAIGASAYSRVTNPVTPGSAVAIAAGGRHTCALRANGTVACWGENSQGELGNGTTDASSTPVAVSGISDATAVVAGTYHTCAIVADGGVRCWGRNDDGTLGNGSDAVRSEVPVPVSGLAGATQLAAGTGHSCARLATGRIACWGNNESGQLGDGTMEDAYVPVTVVGITDAVAVAVAGFGYTCALLADGTVRCWGWNEDGQLGNGTTTASTAPVPVTGLSDVRSIAAGGYTRGHTCAVTRDRQVHCWGENFAGQLGAGTTTDSATPVTVVGLLTDAVTAGGYHSCALTDTGNVRCWGWNEFGQLGDGTLAARSTPADVGDLSGVVAVTGGIAHTCAVMTDGTARCWGWNEGGQLGNATTTDSPTPVTVVGL